MLPPAILVRARDFVFLQLHLSNRRSFLLVPSHIILLSIRRAGQSNLNVHSDKRGRPTKPPG